MQMLTKTIARASRNGPHSLMENFYWDVIKRYPPLTPLDEEIHMLKAQDGDAKSYELVICSNLRFVVNVAKEYIGQGVEFEDLVAEGNLGLVKAYHKFDISKNVKFITYAV